ncbi:hypothetical protein EDC30_109135 [Paucimonas lemoignei]|uniref:Uncharacterized protein n=1 Tax=Paucimonas lemoignei TaxID=29443 RepID=A0A4R3HRT1_PAULE|nr:hypothetical protein [Paucimonas lemoignei]TCS35836.1 hypothetical protein EDC30_109135 [Paucimonas lemoignei]
MKMAKANEQDMEQAIRLTAVLDNVEKGYFPPSGDPESEDNEPTFFDPDDQEHLRVFYERVMACIEAAPGGLMRVTWGFHTLMHNDIVDPDAETLELHPKLVQNAADATLLDWLDTLSKRDAKSDMHFVTGGVRLYVRTGFGAEVAVSGIGTSVREAIAAAMDQSDSKENGSGN